MPYSQHGVALLMVPPTSSMCLGPQAILEPQPAVSEAAASREERLAGRRLLSKTLCQASMRQRESILAVTPALLLPVAKHKGCIRELLGPQCAAACARMMLPLKPKATNTAPKGYAQQKSQSKNTLPYHPTRQQQPQKPWMQVHPPSWVPLPLPNHHPTQKSHKHKTPEPSFIHTMTPC